LKRRPKPSRKSKALWRKIRFTKAVIKIDPVQDMDKEEEEEHQKFITEANFKKRILEQRLHRIRNESSDLIDKFTSKLKKDLRLAPFFKH
jgi:N-glycosylase/DNA lyase